MNFLRKKKNSSSNKSNNSDKDKDKDKEDKKDSPKSEENKMEPEKRLSIFKSITNGLDCKNTEAVGTPRKKKKVKLVDPEPQATEQAKEQETSPKQLSEKEKA